MTSLDLAPSGRILAVSYYGGFWHKHNVVVLWDIIGKPREIATERLDPNDSVRQVAFSPDGKSLALAFQSAIRLWDISAYPACAGP